MFCRDPYNSETIFALTYILASNISEAVAIYEQENNRSPDIVEILAGEGVYNLNVFLGPSFSVNQ
jgi:hypothetical protein